MDTTIKFNTLIAMHKRLWELTPLSLELGDKEKLFNRSTLRLQCIHDQYQDGRAFFYEFYNINAFDSNMEKIWCRILNSLIGDYLFDSIKKSAMKHGLWNEYKDAFCRKHNIKYSNYLMRDVFKKHYHYAHAHIIQYKMEQLIIWDPILSKKYDNTPNIVWDDDGPFRLWKRDFLDLLGKIKIE